MGFLDKAAAKVNEATKAAQEGVSELQAKRKADGLLRELGAWTYAQHKGGYPDAAANIERVLAELSAHERSEEHTSELQSLMRISYAVVCLKKKNITISNKHIHRATKSTNDTKI